MAAKALIKVDVKIAILRQAISDRRANNVTVAQLRKLLEQRAELIPQMLAERQLSVLR